MFCLSVLLLIICYGLLLPLTTLTSSLPVYATLCVYFIAALMVMPSSLFSFNLFHSPICVRLQGMFPSGFGNGWLCVSWNIFFLPTVVSTEGRGELRIT